MGNPLQSKPDGSEFYSGLQSHLESADVQEHPLCRLIFTASFKRNEAVFRIPRHLMSIRVSDDAATTNLLRNAYANPKRFSKEQPTQAFSFESVIDG